ncbi:MAG: prolipoprotein diacylglyceryl transferase [Albidovulum sp.]|nr:prolipoprotein diacylglyceryl transferase [Albidovulum sp.]
MIFAIPFPNIQPEIFSIEVGEFTFALRWYALAYLAGFLIAWVWLASMFRKPYLWPNDEPPMNASQLDSLATWMILGVVLGGRLGYALIYSPAYYFEYPQEILKIWLGGMSFHGGVIGVVVFGLVFCRIYRLPVVRVADAVAITVPWALCLGRISNFINGELWGRATDVPWAVVFPAAEGFDCSSPCPRHPSQIYEALLEGLVLGLVLTWLAYRRGWLKRPGQITGMFAAGYGAARTFVEFFRLPDQQFSTDANPLGFAIPFSDTAGITMGQLLSLPMLVAGLMIIFWARRKSP